MAIINHIQEVRTETILMARKAETIYERAVECMLRRDPELVSEVRRMDQELDELEVRIDRMCMQVLALREPYALDFRFIFSVVRTIRELERVGDQAKTIAKWAPRLTASPDADLTALADKAREALKTAVDAVVENDMDGARRVMQIEFQVDEIEDRIIEQHPEPPLAVAFIAKALERVGDLATNIAENVIFAVSADDIRHGQYRESEMG